MLVFAFLGFQSDSRSGCIYASGMLESCGETTDQNKNFDLKQQQKSDLITGNRTAIVSHPQGCFEVGPFGGCLLLRYESVSCISNSYRCHSDIWLMNGKIITLQDIKQVINNDSYSINNNVKQ